jgi:cytochrome c-type biogenesis protein CcmH
MTIFILVAGILVAVCLVSLAPALLNQKKLNKVDIQQQNLEVARYRLQQLDDSSGGTEHDELEASLLDDLAAPDYTPRADRPTGKTAAAAILLAIPLCAGLLYLGLGNFAWLQQPLPSVEAIKANPAENLQVLLTRLEEKLQEDPDNADGWALAGRTYMTLGRFKEAEQAYRQVHQIVGDNPDILTAWADASLMVNGNQFTDEIAQRINRALELDAKQANALWIAAMGARSRGQTEVALGYIQTLRPLLAENTEALNQLNMITKELSPETAADSVSADSVAAPGDQSNTDVTISVEVSVLQSLAEGLTDDTRVFVFAKAVNGPPFPLAAARLTLADLPTTVVLDDSMGMVPGQVLSSVDQVQVTARISRSGDPVAAPGDFTSPTQQSLTSGNAKLTLKIDQVVE